MTMANTQAGDSFGDAGTGREQTAGGTREQIREMKNQMVDQAKSSVRDAKDRAVSSLGESRGRFADQIRTMADAFRRTGQHLESENQQRIAGLTDSIARQADQVADYVGNFDPRTARDDLERLARRQPVLVIGGAFALGLLGARFFKSSNRTAGRSRGRRDTDTTFASGGADAWS
jgi:CHASE3 domain sensor protein